ncbi:hypothetical protein P8936_14255 [Edaphobacter paludis]|uniref:DUF5666 domain-containing protein n=1 Tax=Edaphobacter paludis TaxID=3035702 RepID=A0AAU7D4U4_9BACT
MPSEIRTHRSILQKSLTLCLALTPFATAQTVPHSPAAIHLVGVRAVLDKTLDARKVKEGDTVLARPEVKIHLGDGVDLETNSKLLGRVDTVQPSLSKSDSTVTVTFDRIQLKDGRQIPIKATILWIGQPPSLLNPTVVSAAADRTTPGVGVGAGMTGTPPAQGYQGSEIAGPPKRHQDRPAPAPAPTGVFSQTNAIPGINFTSDIRKPESGSFNSSGRNVNIPAGTVFAFALAALPTNAPNP